MKDNIYGKNYVYGIKKGIPIALGYLSISFTFGVKAVNGGIPAWAVVLISLTNLTSAGQFAGTNLILAGGGFIEMAVTTLVINIRYMLMSLALTQKIKKNTPLFHRMVMGFGITDEIFAVAASEIRTVTPAYFYGLMTLPVIGWTGGTLLGAVASGLMPARLSNAMELGLYAMFLAIIIPPAKKSRAVCLVIIIAVVISACIYYLPPFRFISGSVRVIIAAVLAAAAGAFFFPVRQMEGGDNDISVD